VDVEDNAVAVVLVEDDEEDTAFDSGTALPCSRLLNKFAKAVFVLELTT
jgi:hypothetical protein